jgi:phytoene synthase
MSVALAPTKQPAGEAFPVASLLLARARREPVVRFYRFARLADDIADAPGLAAAEKLARLDALEAALLTADPAEPAARALALTDRAHGAGLAEARLLLGAFRQDATRARYRDWDELLAYCRRSANPVGRFLLRLHREGPEAEAPADALCTALQILNHLQDLLPDRARLDRVYLPLPWLETVGGEAAFFAPEAVALRRPVLDAALDQVDGLVATAECLPARLADSRLAAQAAATLACARLLASRLRRHDPVVRRVSLGPGDVARAVGEGCLRLAARRLARPDAALTREIVRRSHSSFRLGMASLAAERRRAIHAVYAFCRGVDDAADSAAPPAERRRFLDCWQEEVEAARPVTPVGRELAWACERFDLPRGEFLHLLDGMRTDAATRVRLADGVALERYGRAVAGSVGLISVRIFGAAGADRFALRLAQALQLVNILRDVDEDAARDRVYLPLDRLEAAGIADGPAGEMVRHRRFGEAWQALLAEAELAFADADADADMAQAGLDRARLRPAILMLESYRPLLRRLGARGWQPGLPRPRASRRERLRLLWLMLWGRP